MQKVLYCSILDVYIFAHQAGQPMASIETNTRKIVARLEREGWVDIGGGKHDVFKHPDGRKLVVPRHRTQSIGVARGIAKKAGWM